jgi:hypothetical protein
VRAIQSSARPREKNDGRPPAGRRGRRHLFAHGRRFVRDACVQPWATSAAGHAGPPEASRRFSLDGLLRDAAGCGRGRSQR